MSVYLDASALVALHIDGGLVSGGGAKTVTFNGPGAMNVGGSGISERRISLE